jgi:uncharacterized protein YggE
MKRLAIVAALLLAAAAIGGVARPDGSSAAGSTSTAPQRTITVSGTGTESSTPTRATVSFGVQTQAASAKAALAENAAAMRKVIAALGDAGAKDLRTETVSLSPTFADDQQVQGYIALNSVSATVTYAAAGSTIDAGVDAGANQVYGPSPLAGDADVVYAKALADAVANARVHAKALAAAAGATLGEVMSVEESGSAPLPMFQKSAGDIAAPTPVIPGSQETTASVTVTFELT